MCVCVCVGEGGGGQNPPFCQCEVRISAATVPPLISLGFSLVCCYGDHVKHIIMYWNPCSGGIIKMCI